MKILGDMYRCDTPKCGATVLVQSAARAKRTRQKQNRMSDNRIEFFVPGNPAPGGSKRAFVINGRAIMTDDAGKRNKEWKQDVKVFAAQAMGSRPPLIGPLAVTMIFYVARPKSVSVTKRPYPTVKPDVLKLARSTEDAMTGVVYADDSLTVELMLRKRYGDKPGCKIVVAEFEIC